MKSNSKRSVVAVSRKNASSAFHAHRSPRRRAVRATQTQRTRPAIAITPAPYMWPRVWAGTSPLTPPRSIDGLTEASQSRSPGSSWTARKAATTIIHEPAVRRSPSLARYATTAATTTQIPAQTVTPRFARNTVTPPRALLDSTRALPYSKMSRGVKRPYHAEHRARVAKLQVEATRNLILDAARLLFERDGYHAATIRAIAAEAEVSEPTVYVHFGSKLSLLQ